MIIFYISCIKLRKLHQRQIPKMPTKNAILEIWSEAVLFKDLRFTTTVKCLMHLGWLEKQKVPKNNFRHADPGVCHTSKDSFLSYISF